MSLRTDLKARLNDSLFSSVTPNSTAVEAEASSSAWLRSVLPGMRMIAFELRTGYSLAHRPSSSGV